jgi:type I restriction enzyme M protein
LAVDKTTIKSTIYEHPEFASFITGMNEHFEVWRSSESIILKSLQTGCHPKELIAELSEELLSHYVDKPLIDKYDVYQHLMDYWAETMQDDCYLIAADGWTAEPTRIIEKDKKGKERDKGWTCDLIPKQLIVSRYFQEEAKEIEEMSAELEGITARLTEIEEENSGDEGLLSELEKINKASVTARLREIKGDKDTKEEAALLNEWLKLNTKESDLKKRIKDAEAELDAKAYAQYSRLSGKEIKTLVVDDKWLATLNAAIHGEMERISRALTQRVKDLAERYETPMPLMTNRVAELEAKVNCHLERMGFTV